jgi:hypothetical protein
MLSLSMVSSSFQREMTALFTQGVLLLATSVTFLLVQSRIYESSLKAHFCQFAWLFVSVGIVNQLLG